MNFENLITYFNNYALNYVVPFKDSPDFQQRIDEFLAHVKQVLAVGYLAKPEMSEEELNHYLDTAFSEDGRIKLKGATRREKMHIHKLNPAEHDKRLAKQKKAAAIATKLAFLTANVKMQLSVETAREKERIQKENEIRKQKGEKPLPDVQEKRQVNQFLAGIAQMSKQEFLEMSPKERNKFFADFVSHQKELMDKLAGNGNISDDEFLDLIEKEGLNIQFFSEMDGDKLETLMEELQIEYPKEDLLDFETNYSKNTACFSPLLNRVFLMANPYAIDYDITDIHMVTLLDEKAPNEKDDISPSDDILKNLPVPAQAHGLGRPMDKQVELAKEGKLFSQFHEISKSNIFLSNKKFFEFYPGAVSDLTGMTEWAKSFMDMSLKSTYGDKEQECVFYSFEKPNIPITDRKSVAEQITYGKTYLMKDPDGKVFQIKADPNTAQFVKEPAVKSVDLKNHAAWRAALLELGNMCRTLTSEGKSSKFGEMAEYLRQAFLVKENDLTSITFVAANLEKFANAYLAEIKFTENEYTPETYKKIELAQKVSAYFENSAFFCKNPMNISRDGTAFNLNSKTERERKEYANAAEFYRNMKATLKYYGAENSAGYKEDITNIERALTPSFAQPELEKYTKEIYNAKLEDCKFFGVDSVEEQINSYATIYEKMLHGEKIFLQTPDGKHRLIAMTHEDKQPVEIDFSKTADLRNPEDVLMFASGVVVYLDDAQSYSLFRTRAFGKMDKALRDMLKADPNDRRTIETLAETAVREAKSYLQKKATDGKSRNELTERRIACAERIVRIFDSAAALSKNNIDLGKPKEIPLEEHIREGNYSEAMISYRKMRAKLVLMQNGTSPAAKEICRKYENNLKGVEEKMIEKFDLGNRDILDQIAGFSDEEMKNSAWAKEQPKVENVKETKEVQNLLADDFRQEQEKGKELGNNNNQPVKEEVKATDQLFGPDDF